MSETTNIVSVGLTGDSTDFTTKTKKAKEEFNKTANHIGKKADEMSSKVTDSLQNPTAALSGLVRAAGPVGAIMAATVGAVAALSTAVVSLGRDTAKTQKEIDTLAKTMGVSYEMAQRYAVMADRAGMSVETLADKFLDVKRNVQDMVTSGGGPLQDFLNAIEGKVSTTVEDLQSLSSVDAIKRIISDLEKAGATTEQTKQIIDSMGSDMDKVYDMLKKDTSDLINETNEYVLISGRIATNTSQQLDQIDKNWANMWTNFGVYITNTFSTLIEWVDKAARYIGDWFGDKAKKSQYENVASNVIAGKTVTSGDMAGLDDAKLREEVERQVRISQAAKVATAQSEAGYGGYSPNAAKVSSDNSEITMALDNLNKTLAQRDNDLKIEEAKARQTSSGGINTQSSIRVGSIEQGREELEKLEKQLAATNNTIAYEMGELEKAATEQEKDTIKRNIESAERRRDSTLKQIDDVNNQVADKQKAQHEKQAKLDDDFAKKKLAANERLAINEVEQATIARDKLVAILTDEHNTYGTDTELFHAAVLKANQDLSDKLVEIKKRERDQIRAIEAKKMDDQAFFATQILDKINIDEQQKLAEVNARYEDSKNAQGESLIAEQQFYDKKAEIAYEAEQKRIEEATKSITDDNQRDLVQAEMRAEWLAENQEALKASKEQMGIWEVENSQKVADAEKNIFMSRMTAMSSLFDGMAGILKEGSKAQKVAFMMSKAATIAQIGLDGYAALGAVDSDPSIPSTVKPIRKITAMAETAAQIAGAGAVMISGMAHQGIDNIPSEGTWLLDKNERVLSPKQNSDLTSFLKDNKINKGSGETIINSDFIVQGNLDGADESRFIQMCLQHRDIISGAVRQSNMETGN
ncbi:hypothetical protein D3C77_250750 [compost metagenome]